MLFAVSMLIGAKLSLHASVLNFNILQRHSLQNVRAVPTAFWSKPRIFKPRLQCHGLSSGSNNTHSVNPEFQYILLQNKVLMQKVYAWPLLLLLFLPWTRIHASIMSSNLNVERMRPHHLYLVAQHNTKEPAADVETDSLQTSLSCEVFRITYLEQLTPRHDSTIITCWCVSGNMRAV